ncbi:MAG: hypothetical protein ACLFVJ_14030 [Persicimonas sp.]
MSEPTVGHLTESLAAVGSDGSFHIAFGGDLVRYARWVDGDWEVEAIAPGDTAALALTADNQPMIAFFDRSVRSTDSAVNPTAIRVASRSDAGWYIEDAVTDITRAPSEARELDFTIAADGTGFIAYRAFDYREFSDDVTVARHDGFGWPTERVLGDLFLNSFRLDTGGGDTPLLGMTVFSITKPLQVARYGASGWGEPEEFRPRGEVHNFFATSTGQAAYVGVPGDELAIWSETDDGWTRQACDLEPRSLRYSVASGVGQGQHAVIYRQSADPGGWSVQVADVGSSCRTASAGRAGAVRHISPTIGGGLQLYSVYAMSIAAHGDNRLAVWFDEKRGMLRAARSTNGGASWAPDDIMASRIDGVQNASTVDAAGRPVVASVEAMSRTLYLSTFDGQQWATEEVPVGEGCQITHHQPGAIDVAASPSGDIFVSYPRFCRDGSRRLEDIVVSRKSGDAWEALPRVREGTLAARLAVQPNGQPALAYPGRNALDYFTYDGSQWELQWSDDALAGTGSVGKPGLTYDNDGQPVIAYAGGQVTVARYVPETGWESTQLPSATRGDRHIADVAVDELGVIHLAFQYKSYDDGVRGRPNQLFYARIEQGSVETEIVEETTYEGTVPKSRGTSLVLDGTTPVIVYSHAGDGHLKRARRGEDGWQIDTLDERGDTGQWPSATLLDDGSLLVSYFHLGGKDLCVGTFP